MTDTEFKLKSWRGGQIGAERLAATILHIEGFSAVDPQCPLGGPDGLKDVLCQKNSWTYVGAAYFPTEAKKFSETKKKFLHDLRGVQQNSADGIVFFTNQSLTPGDREKLSEHADALGHKAIIFHLERIRALLDSPLGYGARLEFLEIGMSLEEQLSFFSQWNRSFAELIQEQAAMIIREIGKLIDPLASQTEKFGAKLHQVSQTQSLLLKRTAPSNKHGLTTPTPSFSSKELTVNELCILHRGLLFEAPAGNQVGVLRTSKVWIGGPESIEATARFIAPDPEQVPVMIGELLSNWRESFEQVSKMTSAEKIAAMVRFHHRFVSIHPFLDGNGRIARFLLTQQAAELLNQTRRVIIEDRLPYFKALSAADRGDYAPLEVELTQAILGTDFVAGSPCQMSGQRCPACGEGVMDINGHGSGVSCNVCGIDVPALFGPIG